jgi:response regulator RpfG family c-di-GMP phosphodiesterase
MTGKATRQASWPQGDTPGGKDRGVADIYDALTTERPYRKAYDRDKALEMLVSMKGSVLDPELVDIFSQTIG